MRQAGDSLDFAQDALGADGRGHFGVEDLDRHSTVVLQVLSEEHGGHAAPTERALDPVAVREGGSKALRQVRQGAASGSLNQVNLAHGP